MELTPTIAYVRFQAEDSLSMMLMMNNATVLIYLSKTFKEACEKLVENRYPEPQTKSPIPCLLLRALLPEVSPTIVNGAYSPDSMGRIGP